MIPTAPIPTGSGFWARMVRTDYPEHPPLLVLLVATAVLLLCLVAVVVACVHWIWGHGDLGEGACWALGLSIGGLAILAGYTNRFQGTIGALALKTPTSGGEA